MKYQAFLPHFVSMVGWLEVHGVGGGGMGGVVGLGRCMGWVLVWQGLGGWVGWW